MINKSISIIVPVFNEKECINNAISKINNFFFNEFKDYEILIIESGSTDGTYEICDALAKQYDKVSVFHEDGCNGLGSALKIGFENATKNYVMRIVVDLPFSFDTILNAFSVIKTNDVIFSYRHNDERSIFRKFQSGVFNKIINFSLGLSVKHVNCIPKIYKREIIQSLNIKSNGWFVDAEIVYHIENKNISFIEIPVELIDRIEGQSKVTILTPFYMMKELIAFKKSIRDEK